MKKVTIVLALLCVATFAQQKGSFTDPRDEKTYNTVKIGTQTWMAKNLDFAAEGSKCHDNTRINDESKCQMYGRLYNWEQAMKACPKGWHLPSDAEWQTLVDFAGGEKSGTNLKATTGTGDCAKGWKNTGSAPCWNRFGFSALPGSSCNFSTHPQGDCAHFDRGIWWTATDNVKMASLASVRQMNPGRTDVYGMQNDKKLTYNSVRCVQDEASPEEKK
jgi:uncharacterized protein (TIGR02145 family)